jgi:hypothetical protein
MRTGKQAAPEAVAWYVEAHPVRVSAGTRKFSAARLDDEREKSLRAVIVSSLFVVLFAAAWRVGGPAALDPLLRSALVVHETERVGAVTYTMPDGIYCRHMSFDNATAAVTEGALEPCADGIAKGRPAAKNGFSWDTH